MYEYCATVAQKCSYRNLHYENTTAGYKTYKHPQLGTTVFNFALRRAGAPREISGPGAKNSFGLFGQWSPQNHVMSKKSQSVRRCSNFGPKSSDEQKRVIVSADVQILAQHLLMSKIRSQRPQMFEFRTEIKKKKHHRVRRP